MYAYKFRLFSDEVEGLTRDYEILSNQTFKDFHDVIIQSLGLSGNELASFYTADTKWEKQVEITLMDMGDENEDDKEDANMPKEVMANAVIRDFIDDPHQKLIYEYDFLHLKTFYIEFIKAFEEKANTIYPVCTNKVGELPKANVQILDNFDDLDLELDSDEDFYDEEDFEGLDSEIEIE